MREPSMREKLASIFISYRQADAKPWAIILRDELMKAFGENRIFLDKENLDAGNWRKQILRELNGCKVLLAVIGPDWLTIVDEQNRPRIRLDDDVHHWELATALARDDLTFIPVLVDDASMPNADQLPEDLRGLRDWQARKLADTQGRRAADLAILIKDIESATGVRPKAINSKQRQAKKPSGKPPEALGRPIEIDVSLYSPGSAEAIHSKCERRTTMSHMQPHWMAAACQLRHVSAIWKTCAERRRFGLRTTGEAPSKMRSSCRRWT
jgi:hypothetical protein